MTLYVAHGVVDRLGHVLHVLGVQPANIDASVGKQKHLVNFDKVLNLLR